MKAKGIKRRDLLNKLKVPRKVKGMELNEGFLSWMRPAWRDFKVEINIFDKKAAIERDRQ